MKMRVKIENGYYYPQVKSWCGWRYLYRGSSLVYGSIRMSYDTLKEAQKVLKIYGKQRENHRKVAWEGNSDEL